MKNCSGSYGKLFFQHPEPLRFTQGRWVKGNVVSLRYLIYKCVMALYLLINQTISIVKYPLASDGRARDHVKYLIYATHWGLMIFTLSFCLDAILVLIRHKVQSKMKTYEKRYEVNNCNWSLKISMFLTAISYPWILSVTIVYYAALFKWTWSGTWDSYLDLHVHLIITVISLLDTCVSSRPWSLWHAWCVALCGILYVLFNAIYILAFDGTNSKGEEYIYWILDWKNNPGLSVGVLFGLTCVFSITFCLYCLLAMLRDYSWKKICKPDLIDSQNSALGPEEPTCETDCSTYIFPPQESK